MSGSAIAGALPHSGWWLVDLALRSTVLLALVLIVLVLVRQRSAAHRYVMAMMGILALPVLPVAMIWLPKGFVVLPSFFANAAAANSSSAAAASHGLAIPVWLLAILAGWAIVGLTIGGRSIVASRRLQGFFEAGRQLDRVETASTSACQSMELSTCPPVRISNAVDVPITFGLWAPKILLPADAKTWDDDRLNWVLLHEQAHIARRDPAAQAFTIAICCLFWWQPLVWRLSRRIELEREHAADDLVLAQRDDAVGYARLLVDIAESLRGRPMSAFGLPMARPSQLTARLHAMFDKRVDRRRSDHGQALLAFVALAVLLAPLAAMPGREGVAFENAASETTAAAERLSVVGTTRGHFANLGHSAGHGHGHSSGNHWSGHASGDHSSGNRSSSGHSGHQAAGHQGHTGER